MPDKPKLSIESNSMHRADIRLVTMTIANETNQTLPEGFSADAYELFPTHADHVATFVLTEPLPPGRSATKTTQHVWLGEGMGSLVLQQTVPMDDCTYQGELVFADAERAQTCRRVAIDEGVLPVLLAVEEHTVLLRGRGPALTLGTPLEAALTRLAVCALCGSITWFDASDPAALRIEAQTQTWRDVAPDRAVF